MASIDQGPLGFDMPHALSQAPKEDLGGTRGLFFAKPVHNKVKSEAEGRPVFDTIDYVKLLRPGDNKNLPERKVTERDKGLWPMEWQAYKAGREGVINGMPVDEWNDITRTRAAELKMLRIYTVEQLAEMPDGNISKIGPDGRHLVSMAKHFLEGDNKTIGSLRRALREAETKSEGLQAQLDQMVAQAKAAEAKESEASKAGGAEPAPKAA